EILETVARRLDDAIGLLIKKTDHTNQDDRSQDREEARKYARSREVRLAHQLRAGAKRSAIEKPVVADGFYRLGLVWLVHHAGQGSFFEAGVQGVREQKSGAAGAGLSANEKNAAGNDCAA